MIHTHKIHDRFSKKFGKEYQRSDIHRVCAFFLKQIGKPEKDAINSVKKHWGTICNFLNQW
jgi:hypothetical protein